MRERDRGPIRRWRKYQKRKMRDRDLTLWIHRYKESTPCCDCGNKFPYYIMEFDHLRDKDFSMSEARRRHYDIDVIKEEMSKCELVCANCHRIRTHKRMKEEEKAQRSSTINLQFTLNF